MTGASDPTDARLQRLIEAFDPTNGEGERQDVAASYVRLAAKLHDGEEKAKRRNAGLRLRTGLLILGGMAAAFVAIFLRNGRTPPRTSHIVHTVAGQYATVQLPDGSTATLAPLTTLTFSEREATVSGEVLFDVAPHADAPYVVRTPHMIVRVLGTQFAVSEYASATSGRVVVAQGRVGVRRARVNGVTSQARPAELVLEAQSLAQVTDSGVSVSRGIAINEYIAFAHGTLAFNDMALHDVVTTLEHAYGVTIRVDDTILASRGVTMDVAITKQPITRVLDLLGEAIGAHYVIRRNEYILVTGRSRSDVPGVPQQHDIPQPEKLYGK